jgi:hypothetical protein
MNDSIKNNIEEMVYNEPMFSILCNVKSTSSKHIEVDTPRMTYGNGNMSIEKFRKVIELTTKSISASYTRQQQEAIAKFGIDVQHQLMSVLLNGARQTIFKEIIQKMNNYGDIRYHSSYTSKELRKDKFYKFLYSKFKFLYSLFPIPKEYKKIIDLSKDTKNVAEMQQKLMQTILSESHKIATSTRLGPATHAIVNCKLATILSDLQEYVHDTNGKISTGGIPCITGNIGGITIIVDPNLRWDDDSILLFRQSNKDGNGMLLSYNIESSDIKTVENDVNEGRIVLYLENNITFAGHEDDAPNFYSKIYLNTINLI